MSDDESEEFDALNADWGYPADDSEQSEETENEYSDNTVSVRDLDEVRETIQEEFDERLWRTTEAAMANMATLLLSDVEACAGLVIIGPSGAGKTTTLRFLENARHDSKELVYKSDDFTHAAFVSHDTSRDEEELAENDLLPQIQHRTLAALDMNTWFTGSQENIQKKMSYLARVMDGQGLSRNTGAHGQRGYEGDYRFVLVGATTPLQSRAWDVMGNVGNRLLFHELPGENDMASVIESVFGEEEFGEKVARCQSTVEEYLQYLWRTHGGYASVDWQITNNTDVQTAIAYLANLVRYSRAPVVERNGRCEPQREDPHRVTAALRNLARGHALLCGRTEIEMEDVEVCARVALSTMHKERRGIVRAVVNPDTPSEMTASDIESHNRIEASRKTILDRMRLLDDLDIGLTKEADNGRNTRTFALSDNFVWPNHLPFPG